ncbi:exosortase C-terminal domain/associated protein EpsI [Desulfobacterium sp. N47]
MEQKIIDELDLSEYIIAKFRNPKNREVNFYVAYYESQLAGEAIHSPESCLPASGWNSIQEGTTGILIDDTKTIKINRSFIEKGGDRELVYFWFPQRGRILTNIYQIKLYGFWDALTKRRTDGALVRLITTVYTDEEIKDADIRLQRFAKEIVPVLNQFLPN